jgi:hypothetical protein
VRFDDLGSGSLCFGDDLDFFFSSGSGSLLDDLLGLTGSFSSGSGYGSGFEQISFFLGGIQLN